jgi:hypothetical protein
MVNLSGTIGANGSAGAASVVDVSGAAGSDGALPAAVVVGAVEPDDVEDDVAAAEVATDTDDVVQGACWSACAVDGGVPIVDSTVCGPVFTPHTTATPAAVAEAVTASHCVEVTVLAAAVAPVVPAAPAPAALAAPAVAAR